MKKDEITFSEWANVVTELANDRAEVVPPGWKTAAELIGVLANSRQMVQEHLRNALNHNPPLVEVRKFRIQSQQRLSMVPHYRLLKRRPRARG